MSQYFIFVTGGVLSSLGKGITSASLALILEQKGYNVALLKFDPYLNVDPGTMNPFQHGEVYVTDDGCETDLDLGHYYRFSNSPLSKYSTTTSGQAYESVIKNERRGDYLGKTVQVIPHVTDEIKGRILLCAEQEPNIDITIVEIGGTVGDIESLPFLEAIRQFKSERPRNCLNIHLTHVPYLKNAGEMKTKPTQHSVQLLRQIGIVPDMIFCRTEIPLSDELKEKISLFCSVRKESVIDVVDVDHTIYEVPLHLLSTGVDQQITEMLNLNEKQSDLAEWKGMVNQLIHPASEVKIAIVGKYVEHQDAYKSVVESLIHGGISNDTYVDLQYIDSDEIASGECLRGVHGVLVPGGFGSRGYHGKLIAAQFCRENNIPYFGICMGMQVMAVEFSKNVLGLQDANTTEIDPKCKDPIISLLEEQQEMENLGGTMRLGSYPCVLTEGSLAHKAYGTQEIHERHRHRYEFNNKYLSPCQTRGLNVSGRYAEKDLVEILEVRDHRWMLGVQFHPEFKSKPTAPHPLFSAFVEASLAYSQEGQAVSAGSHKS
ncbi:MAG: CTP synthase [Chlamydiia bacterium]|nr:CTP synthase [Chlamydiia bacterium]